MVDDYCQRFNRLARSQGLRPLSIIEIDAGGGRDAEGQRILEKLPAGAQLFRLDEHGDGLTSVAFAKTLEKLRDRGERDVVFVIGGAEGFNDDVRNKIRKTVAFGPQTWPHKLVRVMLVEQIYRSASLLSGHPYHKA